MAVTGISRIFVSLVAVTAAVVVGWWLWDLLHAVSLDAGCAGAG